MARCQLGVAHVLEIESIEDETKRAIAETKALDIAVKMVLNYENIDTAEKLKNLITEAK